MPPPPNGISVMFQPTTLGVSVLQALSPAAALAAAAAAAAKKLGLIGKYVAIHMRRNDM